MRATIVMSGETARAGTLSARDYIGGPEACHVCGFAPQNVEKAQRANPRVELLEPADPAPRDPLRRSRRRCRSHAARSRRTAFVRTGR